MTVDWVRVPEGIWREWENGEDAVVSEMKRQLVIANAAYRNCGWKLTSTGSVIELFELLRTDAVLPCDSHSISWYRGKSIGHLENKANLSGSALLSAMGLVPVHVFTQVCVCSDLVLTVDQQVMANDGSIFSRNECRAVDLTRFPTPEQIKASCDVIRRNKPHTDYMDQWLGEKGSGIREIKMREIFKC